jgi:phosphate/sulfate permease
MYLIIHQDTLTMLALGFLFFALLTAFAFEFVNGFHDTANAVATVIYTKSLPPIVAVLLSGSCNFAGVMLGGVAVAFTIVHLLPVELIQGIGTNEGLCMILALLVSAILWNLGTWYKGLPASSSHTLIGAIIGVGLANAFITGGNYGGVATKHKLMEVFLSLLFSPLLGFALAALLLILMKGALVKWSKLLFEDHPQHYKSPHWVIRIPTVISSMGVSFTHGANDGQKGIGIIMLILIGLLPAHFAINNGAGVDEIKKASEAAGRLETLLVKSSAKLNPDPVVQTPHLRDTAEEVADNIPAEDTLPENEASLDSSLITLDTHPLLQTLSDLRKNLEGKTSMAGLTKDEALHIRSSILAIDTAVGELQGTGRLMLPKEDIASLKESRRNMKSLCEYSPKWVVFCVAICLGLGTMIGWKRVAVTIGEKIGKVHLTYGQGLIAQMVAASTIFLGNALGMPVSTTHVLSSGVAGTMAANNSGLHGKTVRNIVMAWVMTLPVTMLLSALLFALFRLLA